LTATNSKQTNKTERNQNLIEIQLASKIYPLAPLFKSCTNTIFSVFFNIKKKGKGKKEEECAAAAAARSLLTIPDMEGKKPPRASFSLSLVKKEKKKMRDSEMVFLLFLFLC
jgi:hypothetical protein